MPINPVDRQLSDEALIKLFSDPEQIPERSAPAFMLDENADQRCISPIRAMNLYITTVVEQGLIGETSDFRVLAHARKIGCALIVRDEGFRHLHEQLLDLGLSYAGIIFFSFNRSPDDVVAFVRSINERAIEKNIPSMLRYLYWKV